MSQQSTGLQYSEPEASFSRHGPEVLLQGTALPLKEILPFSVGLWDTRGGNQVRKSLQGATGTPEPQCPCGAA